MIWPPRRSAFFPSGEVSFASDVIVPVSLNGIIRNFVLFWHHLGEWLQFMGDEIDFVRLSPAFLDDCLRFVDFSEPKAVLIRQSNSQPIEPLKIATAILGPQRRWVLKMAMLICGP